MNDNKKEKSFEELADEALNAVAGGSEGDELEDGYVGCSCCFRLHDFSVDTYYGPSGPVNLCRECYEKYHVALGV